MELNIRNIVIMLIICLAAAVLLVFADEITYVNVNHYGHNLTNISYMSGFTLLDNIDADSNNIYGVDEFNATESNTNSTWRHLSYPTDCAGSAAITGLGDSSTCQDLWLNTAGDTATGDLVIDANLAAGGVLYVRNDTGRVGIGVEDPGAMLDIAVSTAVNGITVAGTSTSTNSWGAILTQNAIRTNGNQIQFARAGTTGGQNAQFFRNLGAAEQNSFMVHIWQKNETDDQVMVKMQQVGLNNAQWVYSNVGAAATNSLVFIEVDNVAFTKTALRIQNDGQGFTLEAGTILYVNESGGVVGIGVNDPKTKLHIKEGSAGGYPTNFGVQAGLAIESNTHTGIHLLSVNTSNLQIKFASPTDENVGRFQYALDDNQFEIRVNDTEKFKFKASGNMTFKSPDATEFECGVRNDGSFICT